MTFHDRFLLYFYEQHTVDRFQTDDISFTDIHISVYNVTTFSLKMKKVFRHS